MLFALLVASTLSLCGAILYWRSWQMRRLQWRFLELRDRLRDVAISDAEFARSHAFIELDRVLTNTAAGVPALNLWSFIMGTLALSKRDRENERAVDLAVSRDERLQPILHGMGDAAQTAFIAQHVVLVCLLVLTVVGVVPLHRMMRKVREAVEFRAPQHIATA